MASASSNREVRYSTAWGGLREGMKQLDPSRYKYKHTVYMQFKEQDEWLCLHHKNDFEKNHITVYGICRL